MEKVPNTDYKVFRLVNLNDNGQGDIYVARKSLVEIMEGETEELWCNNISRLGEKLVNYHLKYLKEHPFIDDKSELRNHVAWFNININYTPPYHVKLHHCEILEAEELTLTEKKEFLESIQKRTVDYWESDE
jgi:hypothetical protein